MNNKKVYIILLNYNGWKDTIECLESVLKNDYKNYQIIVVDNDSPNKSMEYIINWAEGKQEVVYDENSQLKYLSQPHEKKPLPYVCYTKEEALSGGDEKKESNLINPIIFIQAEENGGFASGNNLAIKYSLKKNDFNYIWLLNNDTVINKDTLSRLYNFYQEIEYTNNIGILGSQIMYYSEPNKIQSIGRKVGLFTKLKNINKLDEKKKYIEVDDIMGASMFFSKDYTACIGLIPEEYFLYMEETDWNYQGRQKSYKFFTLLDSLVYHKESPSVGGTLSFGNIYYNTRNKILFLKKYYKYETVLIVFFVLFKIKDLLKYIIMLRGDLIKALFFGIRDGLNSKTGQ